MNGHHRKRKWQARRGEDLTPDDRIELIAELMAKLDGVDFVADFFHIRRLKLLITDCLPDRKEQLLRILIGYVNRPPSPATASYAKIVSLLSNDFGSLMVDCIRALRSVQEKALIDGKWDNAHGLEYFFVELSK
ncbi:GL18289 [Drosophila persimilis]|uniref:GL18289 n=1 Tax=Drosophila persimilis TaxID=7234 RepID=B4H4L8_DROPE|nr:GL18289 [Drosophila persimilis]